MHTYTSTRASNAAADAATDGMRALVESVNNFMGVCPQDTILLETLVVGLALRDLRPDL